MNRTLTIMKQLKSVPTTMLLWLEALERTPQSRKWHPEGDSLVHTFIVVNRIMKHKDQTLFITALMHDLGKAITTSKNSKGNWAAHGHEDESAKLCENKNIQEWITENGVKWEDVLWLVKNHMRIKHFDEMNSKKQRLLDQHRLWPLLEKFAPCDQMGNVTMKEVSKAGGNPCLFIFNKFLNVICKK